MKRKLVKLLPLAAVVALVAAVPASTQTGTAGGSSVETNLPLLIAVNQLGLTTDQMQVFHDALVNVLDQQDAIDARLTDFEQEMIVFGGTSDELEGSLSSFRDEMADLIAARQQAVADAMTTVKQTLSIAQGEILQNALPALRGTTSPAIGSSALGADSRLAQSLARVGPRGRMGTAASPGRAPLSGRSFEESASRLRDRLSVGSDTNTDTQSDAATVADTLRERLAQRLGLLEGTESDATAGGQGLAMMIQRADPRGLDWIRDLVQILELKME